MAQQNDQNQEQTTISPVTLTPKKIYGQSTYMTPYHITLKLKNTAVKNLAGYQLKI